MFRQLINSARTTSKTLQKIAEARRCRATAAVTGNAESQRLQNLEQKVREEAASKPDNWDNARPFSEIPGPKPLPILGNMWRFLPIIGDFKGSDSIDLTNGFRKYGDIAVLRGIFKTNMVFLFKPEDIESVFRNEGTWPERIIFKSIEHYQSNVRNDIYEDLRSLVASNGNEWHKVRTIANPILNQIRSIEMYIPEIDSVAQDFAKRIRFLMDNKEEGIMPENFLNELNKWSLESVGFIALDKRLGCLDNNLDANSEPQKVIDSVHKIFEYMFKIEFRPSILKYTNTKNLNKFVKHFDFIISTFRKHIQEAKKKYENSSEEGSKSILQRLLSVNQKIANVVALDLLVAGVDTTAKTAGATLYFLASHKRAQDELRKELITLLPHKDSPMTKEILANAKYLKACIKEGLRMGGITIANVRTTTKDMVVRDFQIPKGTMIQMSAYHNLFSEEQFQRPWEFIPERWLRTNKSETSHKNTHPFVYLPFGFGARSCIGQRVATMELELLLAKIVRNFELEWPYPPAKFASNFFYEIVDPLRFKVKEVSK